MNNYYVFAKKQLLNFDYFEKGFIDDSYTIGAGYGITPAETLKEIISKNLFSIPFNEVICYQLDSKKITLFVYDDKIENFR